MLNLILGYIYLSVRTSILYYFQGINSFGNYLKGTDKNRELFTQKTLTNNLVTSHKILYLKDRNNIRVNL